MAPLDYYKKAWEQVQAHLIAWVVLYTVFLVLSIGTCGLAGLLTPNLMREVRDSLRQGRGPSIGALFDMRHLSEDLVNYLIWFGAISLGGMAGGIGGTVAAVALQFQMPLAADGRYAPMDNAKLSLKHVGVHMGAHIVFFGIAMLISMVAVMLCLLPLPLIAPVMNVAQWLWFEDSRAELDGMASQAGIKLLRAD